MGGLLGIGVFVGYTFLKGVASNYSEFLLL